MPKHLAVDVFLMLFEIKENLWKFILRLAFYHLGAKPLEAHSQIFFNWKIAVIVLM
jgi:hypothetical protein